MRLTVRFAKPFSTIVSVPMKLELPTLNMKLAFTMVLAFTVMLLPRVSAPSKSTTPDGMLIVVAVEKFAFPPSRNVPAPVKVPGVLKVLAPSILATAPAFTTRLPLAAQMVGAPMSRVEFAPTVRVALVMVT